MNPTDILEMSNIVRTLKYDFVNHDYSLDESIILFENLREQHLNGIGATQIKKCEQAIWSVFQHISSLDPRHIVGYKKAEIINTLSAAIRLLDRLNKDPGINPEGAARYEAQLSWSKEMESWHNRSDGSKFQISDSRDQDYFQEGFVTTKGEIEL